MLVLGTPWGQRVIGAMSTGVSNLLGYAQAGTDFIFGPMAGADDRRQQLRDRRAARDHLLREPYFNPILSRHHAADRAAGSAAAIRLVTGITRVESLGAAANIFVGQSESPLVIKPYLANLTPAQLFTIMTVGMAGVAGTILGAYASMIGEQLLPYLLAASFMSAPGGILMAKIIMPDDPEARRLIEPEPVDEARAWRGEAGEHHHGRGDGRADRRQAGRRGRRDGARLRRFGRARQRPARRRRRLVRLSRPVASR